MALAEIKARWLGHYYADSSEEMEADVRELFRLLMLCEMWAESGDAVIEGCASNRADADRMRIAARQRYLGAKQC